MSLRELAKEGKASELWPEFEKRPYAIPKGFCRWELIAGAGAAMLALPKKAFPDLASQLYVYIWQFWLKDNWPVYCLSPDVFRDFSNTDTSDLNKIIPSEWKAPLTGFLLVLPENALVSIDGHSIPFMLIQCNSPENESVLNTENERQITCFFADGDEGIQCIGSGLGNQEILTSEKVGDDPRSRQQADWSDKVRSLVLQVVLSFEYLPELFTEAEPSQRRPPSKRSAKPRPLPPRFIGERSPRRTAETPRGSHSSPRGHWRAGYWRSQPYGPNHSLRKIGWVRPTRVNQSS